MSFIDIDSFEDLQAYKDNKKLLLFYRKGTANSDCAYDALQQVADAKVFAIDVNKVKDVHAHFRVTAVPSFVIVQEGKVKNMVKGCQTINYYDQLIHEKTVQYSASGNEKQQKRVVVYSTPTCTYCNKLKAYFNKHGVRYTDINVASNQQAATEMFRKSGQRGVPQTDINGQIIVGFDVAKISRLLNIPTE